MSGMMELPYYFLIGGAMILLSGLGLWVSFHMPSLDHWSKNFFITLFLIIAACILLSFFEMTTTGNPDFRLLELLLYFSQALLVSFPLIMFTVFLLHSCAERWQESWLFRVVACLGLGYFAVISAAQFTPIFYGVTLENEFVRGPLYTVAFLPLAGINIANLVGVLVRRRMLSKKLFTAFLFFVVPLAVATSIHLFVSVFLLLDLATAISTLTMYTLILSEQIERYMEQQRQIAHQRANIMVLQMRPHFIYNTMTSIYYLCDQDPKKAQQVTFDFSTYLRKNFTAIACEGTVPFSEELEHTRAYLAVEKAQYEDDLEIEYDTHDILFRLPPLILQPIVENAVKHGMDLDSGPLHIKVSTSSTNKGNVITVEDNGVGFERVDNDDPHVALDNIRQRLELMCGGNLEIEPREGGGTKVTVTIP